MSDDSLQSIVASDEVTKLRRLSQQERHLAEQSGNPQNRRRHLANAVACETITDILSRSENSWILEGSATPSSPIKR